MTQASCQKGLRSSLGLGRLTHHLVHFLLGGWALWTWLASCCLQVSIRTSDYASTWANNVRIDNFCPSLFWHTLLWLQAATSKIKCMIRYIAMSRYIAMTRYEMNQLHALCMECHLDDDARPPRSSLGISCTPLVWSQSDAWVNWESYRTQSPCSYGNHFRSSPNKFSLVGYSLW
jgi:hypothetical protein